MVADEALYSALTLTKILGGRRRRTWGDRARKDCAGARRGGRGNQRPCPRDATTWRSIRAPFWLRLHCTAARWGPRARRGQGAHGDHRQKMRRSFRAGPGPDRAAARECSTSQGASATNRPRAVDTGSSPRFESSCSVARRRTIAARSSSFSTRLWVSRAYPTSWTTTSGGGSARDGSAPYPSPPDSTGALVDRARMQFLGPTAGLAAYASPSTCSAPRSAGSLTRVGARRTE